MVFHADRCPHYFTYANQSLAPFQYTRGVSLTSRHPVDVSEGLFIPGSSIKGVLVV